MNSIRYTGIETCKTCIGESNEWILIEYPELQAVKFFEKGEANSMNTLLLDSIIDNTFYFYELNERMCVTYDEECLEDLRHEKVHVNKSEKKIVFRTDNRTIEFKKK